MNKEHKDFKSPDINNFKSFDSIFNKNEEKKIYDKEKELDNIYDHPYDSMSDEEENENSFFGRCINNFLRRSRI
jgi:hypothetical protein